MYVVALSGSYVSTNMTFVYYIGCEYLRGCLGIFRWVTIYIILWSNNAELSC